MAPRYAPMSELAAVNDLVAVVDDDASVCDAIARVLQLRGYRVAGFTRARDYLAQRSQELQPACLLADIRMPEVDGLELYRRTRIEGIEVPTIFITGTTDLSVVVDAMKSGAADLLPKPFSAQALYGAVERAVQRSRDATNERWSVVRLWEAAARLTPREAEVAGLVSAGLLNKQVALQIGTSEKTVKVHRARAMRKLDAHSLADLVRVTDRLLDIPVRRVVLAGGSTVQRPAILDRMAEAAMRSTRLQENDSQQDMESG